MTEYQSSASQEPSEPLVTTGTITAVVTALIALFVAFGLPVSDDQQAAILGVVAVVAPFVVAFVGRRRVYSPRTVAQLRREVP